MDYLKTCFSFNALCISIVMSSYVSADSIDKAKLLNEHGLVSEAKSELIEHIFGGAPDSEIASSYYLLGTIAFEGNDISAAFSAWNKLVDEYPNSQESIAVRDRLTELAEVIGESTSDIVNNVVAHSYLSHAEFWSRGKKSTLQIDSSWIENVEAAIVWYDKIIAEFPETAAADRAYIGKMKTLIGWKEPRQYGSSYGLEKSITLYMPQLIATFSAYEAAFPNSGSLQAFRYQIAQGYWSDKDWSETRNWLNKIVSAGSGQSFYKDLAERRLAKVEY